MPLGKVKHIDQEKQFGFITSLNGEDHFFHRSHCPKQFNQLRKGDEVEFEKEEGPKGPRAKNVRKL